MYKKIKITALAFFGAGILMSAHCGKNIEELTKCKECKAKYRGETIKTEQVCDDEKEAKFRNENSYYEVTCY